MGLAFNLHKKGSEVFFFKWNTSFSSDYFIEEEQWQ